ncbi:hypothetical protein RvY_05818 [Ramazzottius varieornatus]|uniref:Copper transporter n=1 Tax=Ramazzottius varieornatus TaxID=947166 RepID=A0A1D1V623_RAMVA|nr:hypothetical protein RvY_05818 [Ramazzottius varieornatus]
MESTEAPPDAGLSINTNGPPPETTVYIFYAPFLEFGFTPTVVLQQFTIHTMAQFYGALGAVAGTAFLYQLLAAFKERLYNRYLRVQRLRISNDIDTGEDEESCDGFCA